MDPELSVWAVADGVATLFMCAATIGSVSSPFAWIRR